MPRPLPRARRYSFRQRTSIATVSRPMSELNITPLIDVLLVLLVMIMLSIPAMLHKVEVDIAAGKGSGEPPVINNLYLDSAGRTILNGEPIGRAALKEKLVTMARDPDKPELRLETAATARYEEFDHLIAAIKRSGVKQLGFVGNQRFEKWDEL